MKRTQTAILATLPVLFFSLSRGVADQGEARRGEWRGAERSRGEPRGDESGEEQKGKQRGAEESAAERRGAEQNREESGESTEDRRGKEWRVEKTEEGSREDIVEERK